MGERKRQRKTINGESEQGELYDEEAAIKTLQYDACLNKIIYMYFLN